MAVVEVRLVAWRWSNVDLHRAIQLAQPHGVQMVRHAMRFGREHELAAPRRDWWRLWQESARFGLNLLPPGLVLDGLVVDVGANEGDFAAMVRWMEPRSRVLCVEPAPGPAAALTARYASDPNVSVERCAVSDHDGQATLNVTESSDFSSLHEPRDSLAVRYTEPTAVKDRVEVPLATLDSLVTEHVRVLKVDVQGHEIPALMGASRTLARTEAVLLEVLFTSHYEGDATFSELTTFMEDQGFVLRELGELFRRDGRPLWADACYVAAKGQFRRTFRR